MRNEIAATIAATAFILLTSSTSARTPHPQDQQPPPPPQQQKPVPIFRSGADVVRLDVSVLDAQRMPVRGLRPDDFVVKEDGKPQPIVAFSDVDVPTGRVSPVWERGSENDVATNQLGEHRLFAIVLDTGAKPTNAPRTGMFEKPQNPAIAKGLREIVQAIVDRMGPDDVAAITGATCFQPFTSDRIALQNAIDEIDPFGAACPARLNRIVDMPAHSLISDVTAYVSAAPQRRKVVIYIGPGIDLDSQFTLRSADDLQGAVLAARRGNVNIYAINTAELLGRMETERTKMARVASLRELADHTGGKAILDLEGYPAGLDQLFRENSSYYMLGYRTHGADNDGRRHDIEVRVASPGHENLLVRARSAIMRGKPSTSDGGAPAIEPSKELAPDLEGLVPNLDVTFNANVLAYARPGGKAAVAVITELAEPVASGMTRVVQQMDVRLIAYDERGSVSAQTAERASIDSVPSFDGQVHYRVMTKWDLAPGPYKLRLVAQNPVTRKLSNMEFDMSVPDFEARAISLSGVAVTALPDPAPVPTFGSIAPVLTKVPTISREFASDTILTADVSLYQGGAAPPEPATMEIALLDSDGARQFHRIDPIVATKFDNKERAADYHLDLALESFDLRPGEYLLTMQATVGSHHSPRRDIRFSVR